MHRYKVWGDVVKQNMIIRLEGFAAMSYRNELSNY